jgi:hypothetical protein
MNLILDNATQDIRNYKKGHEFEVAEIVGHVIETDKSVWFEVHYEGYESNIMNNVWLPFHGLRNARLKRDAYINAYRPHTAMRSGTFV